MIRSSGLSLVELMVAVTLFSLVFIGMTVVYVTSFKSFKTLEAKDVEISSLLAIEHMARRIGLGNEAFSPNTRQLKIRWDYDTQGQPLGGRGTPADLTDDTFLKYGIVGDRLRFRIDPVLAPDVGAADPEVVPGLLISSAASQFVLLTNQEPRNAQEARRVRIDLRTVRPDGTNISLRTQIALQERSTYE